MDKKYIENMLLSFKEGNIEMEDVLKEMTDLPFKDIGHTVVDNHRSLRNGYPEVIYGQGKTNLQIVEIFRALEKSNKNILITRTNKEVYETLKVEFPQVYFNELGKIIALKRNEEVKEDSYIAVVGAGTSDLPVVEEAVETAKLLGNKVEKVIDIGVAGIHRLFEKLDIIRGAKVVIVIAGMEGALASVVGGLVDKPVIAVPTSVGYGASFKGVAALLAMLNSCASGVTVVNIDNGFGAAYSASMINKL